MYQLLKPFLFLLAPEQAHNITVKTLQFAMRLPVISSILKSTYRLEEQGLNRKLLGLDFPNPVGLAAGFDKDGKYYEAMSVLGFGFLELGTVTPKPQVGNPKPRLFRLPKDNALINRMGFNNDGVDALVERLKQERPKNVIIGGNIGKNKTTPNEKAVEDYTYCFEALFPYVDYFVVNISSPNTPNLRALQDKAPLTKLLTTLQTLNQQKKAPKPILLKIAPDLSNPQIDDILEIVQQVNLDGIIATNTTIARSPLTTDAAAVKKIGNGGLSGAPLKKRSTEVIRYIYEKTKGDLIIIGVGGIESAADAQEKLAAGASLVQVYSGLVYEGPMLIKQIKKSILKS